MKYPNSRVIIANSTHAAEVENLRREAYHNSSAFKIIDENDFEKYCKWGQKDDSGIVLLAITEKDEAASCLRGNIYFTEYELESNNLNFKNNSQGFIEYPVLDMSFAATCPKFYQNGLLSVLRYYMYFLHRHSVKTISGAAVKNSNIYKTLEKIGYDFKEVENVIKARSPVDAITIAKLNVDKLGFAISYLKEKYAETINNYPLVIT